MLSVSRLKKHFLSVLWLSCGFCSTTANGQEFSPAEIISDQTQVASGQQMAANSKGKVILVWVSAKISGGTSIQASVYNPKTGVWSNTILEESMSGVNNAQPQVAINDHGQAIAIWGQGLPNENVIRYATFLHNKWSQPQTLFSSRSPDVSVDFPHVGIDACGRAQAIWFLVPLTAQAPDEVLLASSFDGKKWSNAAPLDTQKFFEESPSLAVNPKGEGLAVWLASTEPQNPNFVRASFFKNGRWSPPVTLESAGIANSFSGAQVQIDFSGNGAAIWGAFESDAPTIHADSFIKRQWSPVVTVASGDSNTEVFAQKIALDACGNGVAVWQAVSSDETSKIQAAKYHAKKWQAPVTLTTATGLQFVLSPNIGLDNSGNGAAVWVAKSNLAKTVQLLSYINGDWSSSITEVSQLRPASPLDRARPIVKADACGSLFVSWIAFPPAPGRTSLFASVGKQFIPVSCACPNIR